ncbi:MAG: ribosome silencing factor [Candidatus Omnitrophica bacterium]|nr:ribosome silencing factor [Candidatus Omnitrophota bacterium]
MNIVQSIVNFAEDKKAQDIKILDMRSVANFCDYFIICTGTSDRQVKAIADGIELGLNELGIKVRYKQGLRDVPARQSNSGEPTGSWVLLDLGDVVTHIFEPNAREFYSLEYLWRDSPEVQLSARKSPKKKA